MLQGESTAAPSATGVSRGGKSPAGATHGAGVSEGKAAMYGEELLPVNPSQVPFFLLPVLVIFRAAKSPKFLLSKCFKIILNHAN